MLFKPRGVQAQREEKPKVQMTLADMLAFRDTWVKIPYEGFSVDRVLLQARLEKQRKAEVPKLVMSENGFRVRDKTNMDESEIELRRVQGALNKLTDKNFDSVTLEMLSEDLVSNTFVLKGAVNIIFSKAVAEPVFSNLYARLCARIGNYENSLVTEAENRPELLAKLRSARAELGKLVGGESKGSDAKGAEGKGSAPPIGDCVRRVLLLRCQEFYNQFTKQAVPESAEAEEHLRKQNMANIKFLGELYMKGLVTTPVTATVASHALGLRWLPEDTKMTVTDVDLELIYNLMTVIGKRLEDNLSSETFHALWDPITKYAEDKAFSMRIRCLLQNLVDLRKNGWKAKDSPAAAAAEEDTQGQQQSASGNFGQQYQQKQMRRATSMQAQDTFGSANRRPLNSNMAGNPMAGARRGEGVTSYNDLSQFGSGPGGFRMGAPLPPPPPFNPTEPPPPFPGTTTAPEMSEEDRKLVSLAQPPPSLTETVEKSLLSIMRDATVDGDWAAALNDITNALTGEQKHTCLTCAAYSAMKKICMSSAEDDRKTFGAALDNATLFDVNAISGGYAWFLTDAISNNMKEIVPRVSSRFVTRLVGTKTMGFLTMIRDVLARTATYLDALYIPLEGEGCGWEEEYVDMWASVLKQWCADRADDPETKDASKILDCIASVKQRPFMRDTAADFLMELSQAGLITDEAVQQWVETSGKEEKNKALAEQLEQLFL